MAVVELRRVLAKNDHLLESPHFLDQEEVRTLPLAGDRTAKRLPRMQIRGDGRVTMGWKKPTGEPLPEARSFTLKVGQEISIAYLTIGRMDPKGTKPYLVKDSYVRVK